MAWKRPDRAALLLTAICAFVAIVAGLLLARDIVSDGGTLEVRIAELRGAAVNVQRKHRGSFVWSGPASGAELYAFDMVKTGVGGAAEIVFDDGRRLELEENTVVVLRPAREGSLDFLGGSLVLFESSGEARVLEGAAGAVTERKVLLDLLAPRANDLILGSGAKNEASIEFKWRAVGESQTALPAGLTLIVARDADLAQSVVSRPLPAIDHQRESLSEGGYHWAVVDAQGNRLTPVRKLRVVARPELALVAPRAGHKLLLPKGGEVATFRWDFLKWRDELAGSFQAVLVVGAEPSLTGPATRRVPVELERRAHPVSLEGQAGRLYWKLSARFKSGETLESRTIPFELVALTSIGLVHPEPEARIEFWERPAQLDFRFAAGRLDRGGRFDIEIYKDEVKGAPVLTTSAGSENARVPASALPIGKLWWRVVKRSQGAIVQSSDPRPFHFVNHQRLAPPKLEGLPLNGVFVTQRDRKPAALSWNDVPEATAYRVRVERLETDEATGASRSKVVIERELEKRDFTLPVLPEGDYRVGLSSRDPLGRWGERSVERIGISWGERLRAPKIKSREVQ